VYCVESNIFIGILAIILWGECDGDSSVEARGLAPGTSRAQQSLEPASCTRESRLYVSFLKIPSSVFTVRRSMN